MKHSDEAYPSLKAFIALSDEFIECLSESELRDYPEMKDYTEGTSKTIGQQVQSLKTKKLCPSTQQKTLVTNPSLMSREVQEIRP